MRTGTAPSCGFLVGRNSAFLLVAKYLTKILAQDWSQIHSSEMNESIPGKELWTKKRVDGGKTLSVSAGIKEVTDGGHGTRSTAAHWLRVLKPQGRSVGLALSSTE